MENLSSETRAQIIKEFKSLDRNGNGKLDAVEFKACLKSIYENLDLPVDQLNNMSLNELIHEADTDRSGYVSLDEFFQYLQGLEAALE